LRLSCGRPADEWFWSQVGLDWDRLGVEWSDDGKEFLEFLRETIAKD